MKWEILVNDERHGDLWDEQDGEAAINAAVDLIDPPAELRHLFLSKLLNGSCADDGEQRVEFRPVEDPT